MKVLAETERLIIREILLTDVDEMFELHSDPEVHTAAAAGTYILQAVINGKTYTAKVLKE